MTKSLFLMATTLAVALISSPSFSQQRLANTKWQLVSFGKQGAEVWALRGSKVTINFDVNLGVSGSGGCNSYGGSYKTTGSRISFSQIFSTQRACVDNKLNSQEQQFFGALRSTSNFQVSESELHISYDGAQGSLNFSRDAEDKPSSAVSEEQTSPESALVSFFEAINNKDYDRAFSSWETAPSDLGTFKRGYANTTNVRLLVGLPVQIEGAAGSLYADVSVVLVSQLRSGQSRIFSGCYTMRKSNLSREDNPNAMGWRIYKASVTAQRDLSRASEILTNLCKN